MARPVHLRLDGLSSAFLVLLGATAAGISIFAAGYFRRGEGTPPGLMCLQYHLFLASTGFVLLADDAYFVVVTDGDKWLETSLLRPGEEPVLGEGHVANVVSWSGRHDKVVTYTAKRPVKGT